MSEATAMRYRGMLAEHDHGEGTGILFLDPGDDPLAGAVSDDLDQFGHYLTVRYWTATEPRSDEDMIEGAIREMLGAGDAVFQHRYSDITGYLWTDEEINVGGHDLLEELGSQKGRYCLLEITYAAGPLSER